MTALDTNVLVRFLVQDDAKQHRRASAFVEAASKRNGSLLVVEVVLCELVWVLRYSYKVPRAKVVAVLRQLLQARQLKILAKDLVARAVDSYEAGRGDFADYLIREQALVAGADAVATFDRELRDDDGFTEPP